LVENLLAMFILCIFRRACLLAGGPRGAASGNSLLLCRDGGIDGRRGRSALRLTVI